MPTQKTRCNKVSHCVACTAQRSSSNGGRHRAYLDILLTQRPVSPFVRHNIRQRLRRQRPVPELPQLALRVAPQQGVHHAQVGRRVNGVDDLLDVHKIVLLAQLRFPEPVFDDEGQSAAHDGVRVLLGFLRNVTRHAL
ncbi:MAG: hypothetical protein CMM87_05380 [Rickettsiales bacterium]|nr:hypothetical protein [Rickettsiales bacterium]